jgi:hypothetical protein
MRQGNRRGEFRTAFEPKRIQIHSMTIAELKEAIESLNIEERAPA